MTPRKKEKAPPAKEVESQIIDYIRNLGRAGGKKRSENLTPERRIEIARKAALARWAKADRRKD